MFSGIVEEYAEVVKVVKDQENLHLTLKCSFVDELKIDQSVSDGKMRQKDPSAEGIRSC